MAFRPSCSIRPSETGEAGGGFGKQPVLPLCRAPPSMGLGPYDSLMQWACQVLSAMERHHI